MGAISLPLQDIQDRYIEALMEARKLPVLFWRRRQAAKHAEREAEKSLLALGWPSHSIRLILRDARDIAGLDF
jgi:hypothetical protein